MKKCPTCHATMVLKPGVTWYWCRNCGDTWDPSEEYDQYDAYAEQYEMSHRVVHYSGSDVMAAMKSQRQPRNRW